MDNDLKEIESQLEKLSPTGMPSDMVARMAEAMDRWQESVPVEEKIVPFQSVAEKSEVKSSRFNIWASAAAVALMGAVGSVVMMDAGMEVSNGIVSVDTDSVGDDSNLAAGDDKNVISVSNGSFDSQIVEKPSQKIVYDADGRPQRLVRVEFIDRVTMDGSNGEKLTVEKPSVEYYMVPLEVR